MEQNAISADSRARTLPRFLIACGRMWHDRKDTYSELVALQRAWDDFPAGTTRREVVGPLARAILQRAPEEHPGTMTPPSPVGRDPRLGQQARVTMRSASPYRTRIVLDGTPATIITIAACGLCRSAREDTEVTCTNAAPRTVITLPAGRYSMYMSYLETVNTPAVSHWDLRAGAVYDDCYWTSD